MSALLPVALAAGNALLAEASAAETASRRRAAANAQAADLRARTAERERLRRRRLKQALARARARFGAAGTGSAGGSAAALLGGLAAESEREGSYAGNAASRRLAALRADRAHAGRLDRLGLLRRTGGLLALGDTRRRWNAAFGDEAPLSARRRRWNAAFEDEAPRSARRRRG